MKQINSHFFQKKHNIKTSNSTIHKMIIGVMFCLLLCLLYFCIDLNKKHSKETQECLKSKCDYNQIKANNNDLNHQLNILNSNKNDIEKNNQEARIHQSELFSNIYAIQREVTYKETRKKITKNQLEKTNKEIDDSAIVLQYDKERQILIEQIFDIKDRILQMPSPPRENSKKSTPYIDSKIILSKNEFTSLKKLIGFCYPSKFKLLYRHSSIPIKSPKIFHEKCDYRPNTLILIHLSTNEIVGGYISITWNDSGFKTDYNAFIFNFSKMKKYSINNPNKAISISPDMYPCFGIQDLVISYNDYIFSNGLLIYGEENLHTFLMNKTGLRYMEEFEVFQIDFLIPY